MAREVAAAWEEGPLVVLHAQTIARSDGSRRLGRLIPAWILSALFHVGLLAAFLSINFQSNAETPDSETAIIETSLGDEETPPNLDNDEVGLDPTVQTNYNVERIEEVSVPGPVNVQELVGIENASGPPMSVPPPAGVGGVGTGGAADDPNRFGMGSLTGLAGGMGGLKQLPGGVGGRSGATRQKMLVEGGGNAASEAAVAKGLKWLAAHQAPDGRWSLDLYHQHGRCNCAGFGSTNDAAGTGFALLPFLAAGNTHKTNNETANLYTKVVERGLRFLVSQQSREGAFTSDMYANAIASIALCEAYAMTSDPVLRPRAQKAVEYICAAQNTIGGWDYSPRGPTPDTSISAWQIQALKSAQMGGLDVPRKTLLAATHWLDEWSGDSVGSVYGYRQPRNQNPSEGGASPQTMVAAGLLCRQYLGWGPRSPGLIRAAPWFLQNENMPLPANRRHTYYWYYATQVLHHQGGFAWDRWNVAMRDLLIKTQDDGAKVAHQKGSWDPAGDWWCQPGGRIMSTSMSLLTLEVYYRHLPLYRREIAGDKALLEK